MVKIEVLGTGCAKCNRLEKFVKKALEELGMQAELVKIEDLQEIVNRGIMMTPALIIDGETKSLGRVPGVKEIKQMIKSK